MKYTGKVEVASALLQGACNGYVTFTEKADMSFSMRLNTEYTYRSGPKQQIVLNNKVRYRTTNNLNHYFISRCVSGPPKTNMNCISSMHSSHWYRGLRLVE